jgi:outer membrane lipoprotein-sorting protein
MDLSLNQTILEKEVLSEKIDKKFLIFLSAFFFLISFHLLGIEASKELKDRVLKYINNIHEFSSDFIQYDDQSLESGSFYIKNKRIRIQYTEPSNIRLILTTNKAMYYNEDLKELEYFNPRNSVAEIFYNIFYLPDFFDNSNFYNNEGYIIMQKLISIKQNDKITIKIFFEKNPLVIRKVEIYQNNQVLTFGIINPNHNPSLDDKFFSMVSPIIIN